MDLNKRQQDWEEEAPWLAALERSNPFLVPDSYFDELPRAIDSKITLNELEISETTGFAAPDNYFNELSDRIEASIAIDELKEDLTKTQFSVPSGYFEQLNLSILDRTVMRAETKVRKLSPSWFNYVAAACLTVAVGITLLLNMPANTARTNLSEVPDQEIVNYLELYSDQFDTPVIVESLETENTFSGISATISDQELQQYLEETSL